jgi:hypothetical protein
MNQTKMAYFEKEDILHVAISDRRQSASGVSYTPEVN